MSSIAFSRATLIPRKAGPATIVALVVVWAAVWLELRPRGQATASYLGQLCGAESILLLSIGLVLISTLPLVETWFDGIDRAAIWHRRVAITGTLFLIPHILLAKNPRGGSGKLLAIAGALGLLTLSSGRSCRAGVRSYRVPYGQPSSRCERSPGSGAHGPYSAAMSAGARFTASHGSSWPWDLFTASSTGRRSRQHRRCAGST
jgi:hypothetical protein